MDFFEQFDDARWEFTYGDAEDAEDDDRNVLQIGMVATFYIDQCYLPQKRQGLADALALYYRHFGKHFRWCAFDHKEHQPSEVALEQCLRYIGEQGKHIEFAWSSEQDGWKYAGDYVVNALSMQGWHEQVHRDLSRFIFYLPVEALHGEGKATFEQLLLECCRLLQPLHGLAGLGMQVCYEYEEYQDLEFEVSQNFNGIAIGSPDGDPYLREGFSSINWYTILADQWVSKLGGAAALRTQLNDERIAMLPYQGGMVIRAGEWPELGWVRRNPYPELYVKVNEVLRPVRAPEVGSFHYGSIGDEVRFDKESSNVWLRRFDGKEGRK